MRFSIVLIAGMIIVSLLNFLQVISSIFDPWFFEYGPSFVGVPVFPLWFFGYMPGFITGLVMGYLVKGVGKGILGGLISLLLGSIIGVVGVLLWYGDIILHACIVGLFFGLWLVLVSLLPGVSCVALGILFSKKASRIRELKVKYKILAIVAVSVVGFLLIASIVNVALIARYSHERCDGLVRLLEDQYSYVATERPMELREETLILYRTKLIDCGESDEKFISELLDSGNGTRVYYSKIPTAACLWFYTRSWDRVVYVRYGLGQFEPIRSVNNLWTSEFLPIYFIFPILILAFVADMFDMFIEPKRQEAPLAQAVF